MKRIATVLGILIIIAGIAHAFEANMYVFAVTETGEGVPATLTVDVNPGNGNIAIDLGKSIVGESTQESVRDAITAATNLLDVNKDRYDFFVKIESPAEKIDGPSAGLAIALAVYGALKGEDVPDYISATGQIDADGTVYPVGGVYEKAKAAHDVGVKIFLIPAGERNTTAEIEEEVEPGIVETVVKNIDLVTYAKQTWGMDVYEVQDLEQAVKIVFEGERPETNVSTTQPEELENFVPPEAEVNRSAPFKDLAEKLVRDARKAVTDAQSCSLTLKDPSIEQALRDSLKTSDSMATRAALLLDKGYYYTAANYAFLAKIDAETYANICEHPSLLNPNSVAFQDLLNDTENRINTLFNRLNDVNMNRNNFEWIGAARDRFIRAKYNFENLKLTGYTEPSPLYLRQLISIREWLDSAEEMYNMGKDIDGPQIGDLEELAKQAIISVEDVSQMVDISDQSIQERIAWAKTAYEHGWYYTAALEAASASGLAMGNVIADRKDPLSALAESMSHRFEPAGIWDELYLNHAAYYYEAAKYYKREGKNEKAKDMARTGLQLYHMAGEIQKIHRSIYSAPSVVVSVEKTTKIELDNKTTAWVALAVLVVSTVLLILLLASGRREDRRRHHEEILKEHRYRRKIMEVEHQIRELEKRLKKSPEDKELKAELAKLKRLLGRYRKSLERIRERKGA